MPINHYYSLFFSFIICYLIVIPADAQGKLSLIIRDDQRSLKDDQIIGVKKSLIEYLLTKTTNEQKLREKRDDIGSMDIKAIQATVNDHRTMIQDNRLMINNIVNNAINNNTIRQAISNHYSNTVPIWNSWRDVALIFVVCVSLAQIIYCCACQVKLRPCDYLLSRIVQRYDGRQSEKQRPLVRLSTIDNRTNMLYSQKRKYPSTVPQSFVTTVEDDYADIHQKS